MILKLLSRSTKVCTLRLIFNCKYRNINNDIDIVRNIINQMSNKYVILNIVLYKILDYAQLIRSLFMKKKKKQKKQKRPVKVLINNILT